MRQSEKKDGEMMKKSSVNLLKYGLAKHLKDLLSC